MCSWLGTGLCLSAIFHEELVLEHCCLAPPHVDSAACAWHKGVGLKDEELGGSFDTLL